MKKLMKSTLLGMLILCLAATAFAETKSVKIDSIYKPGDMTLSASIGFGYLGLAIYPGAEFLIAQTRIADALPMDFGVAARGFFSSYSDYGWKYTAYGLGAFATAHLSFKEFDLPFDYLDNMDFYIGLGAKFDYFDFTYDSVYYTNTSGYGGLGFSSIAGINYFFNDHLAVVLEGTYWGTGGGVIGLLYKL